MKNFSLGAEQRYLQLRCEAEKLFNHMNAANPVNSLNRAAARAASWWRRKNLVLKQKSG
jgi:hypothetical protein